VLDHEADPLVCGVQQVGAGDRDLETLELAGAGDDGLGHDLFLSTVVLVFV
jgi:hypothetical protein